MEKQEQQQKEKFEVNLKRTLWNHTYRGTVCNDREQYLATIRVILGIPLDRSEVPENAPTVYEYITVLVEDAELEAEQIIDFETTLAPILMKKISGPAFRPQHCFFFYPSPNDVLVKAKSTSAVQS